MKNKIYYLGYLAKLTCMSLILRVANRYWSKSDLQLHIKIRLFKEVRSWHDRRWLSAPKLLRKNLFLWPFDKIEKSIDDDNQSYIEWPINNAKSRVYLVGDSHAEFYGRHKLNVPSGGVDCCVLWLGPRTILGGYYSGLGDEWSKFCSDLVSRAEENGQVSKQYFAYSLGSIDIRCLFFQLTKFGPRLSEKELMEQFKSAVDYFFENVIVKIMILNPTAGAGVFEILYCTDLPSEIARTNQEIRKILKERPYPILGSFEQRSGWCDDANGILKSACAKYNVDFLPVNKHLKNCCGKNALNVEDSKDRFHTTNQAVIDGIFSEVLNRMEIDYVS